MITGYLVQQTDLAHDGVWYREGDEVPADKIDSKAARKLTKKGVLVPIEKAEPKKEKTPGESGGASPNDSPPKKDEVPAAGSENKKKGEKK